MKIFIGSSKESVQQAHEIAFELERSGINASVWDSCIFLPSVSTFDNLERIANGVNAALFVFSPDDQLWYREEKVLSVRDNVLLETGLFAGKLGKTNVVICTTGDPKIPTDLFGITTINLDYGKNNLKANLDVWLSNLKKNGEIQLRSRMYEEKIVSIEERWRFAREIVFVNFAATTFLGSSQIASESVYSKRRRELFERKIKEGTLFRFLLTNPGSYADYDAAKYKMCIPAHSHIRGKDVISIAAKTVRESCKKYKHEKGSIEYRFTDVALPYGAMLIINDEEHSFMNQIKVDLYSPYIQNDRNRRSFTIYANDQDNYNFFYNNITKIWANAHNLDNFSYHEIKSIAAKRYSHYKTGDLDCTIDSFDEEFVSPKYIETYTSTFFLVIAGSVDFKIKSKVISLVGGDAILVPKQTYYSYKVAEGTHILKIKSLL